MRLGSPTAPDPLTAQGCLVTALPAGEFSADIPAAAVTEGALLRWYVTVRHGAMRLALATQLPAQPECLAGAVHRAAATQHAAKPHLLQTTDTAGNPGRLPPFNSDDAPFYYGTVVASSDNSSLPIMEWRVLHAASWLAEVQLHGPVLTHLGCRFAPEPSVATSTSGSNGSSLYFLNRYYDNAKVKRTGVTSVNWPKPKLKFSLDKKVRHAAGTPARILQRACHAQLRAYITGLLRASSLLLSRGLGMLPGLTVPTDVQRFVYSDPLTPPAEPVDEFTLDSL